VDLKPGVGASPEQRTARVLLIGYATMFCTNSTLAQASRAVSASANPQITQPKNAEPTTIKANRHAASHLPAEDGIEATESHRGFVATLPDSAIKAAKAGMDIYYQHRPFKPVVSMIYSHSHLDHFGEVNWRSSDTKQHYVLNLENSASTYLANRVSDHDATITLDRPTLDAINLHQTTFRDEVMAGNISIEGDVQKLIEFNSLFDSFVPDFSVVIPMPLPADHGRE